MSREKTTEKNNADAERLAKMQEELAKKELQAVRQLVRGKGIAARLDALPINWTDDHEKELMRLATVISQKPAIEITNDEEGQQALARIMPAWPKYDGNISYISTMKARYKHALNVVEAFSNEWAHILDDSNQTSLYGQELADDQRAVWENYYEMDADARRFYLLIAASSVMFLQEVKKEPIRSYVSRGKMEKAGTYYDKTPYHIAIPTGSPYSDALAVTMPHTATKDAALLDVGGPLVEFMNKNGLDIEDTGKLFKRVGGILSSRDVADMLRKGRAGDEDYSAVYFVYSATIANYSKTGKKEIELCWNDIESALNLKHGSYTREAFISRVRNLNNKIGYLKGHGYYAVCLFKGFDIKTNKMTFEAPYCIELIKAQQEAALVRGKNGNVLTSKDGRPKMRPMIASDLRMSALPSGRDNSDVFLLAVEVTKLVNRSGKNNTPRTTWRNLICKVPGLLEKILESSNARQLLKRLFTALWEMLRNDSKLAAKVVIPEIYPTLTTLDEIVEFRRVPSETTPQKSKKS